VKKDNERGIRMSVPVHAGEEWHVTCVAWLHSIGLHTIDTHRTKKSADVMITLPGRQDMRILVDFKAGTLSNKGAELSKLAGDFDGLSKGSSTRCDFAMLMYKEGEIGKVNENGNATNIGYLSDPRVSSHSSGRGWDGCLREDRTYICDKTTFLQALNRMIESIPPVGSGVVHTLSLKALSICASVLDAKTEALVVAASAVGDQKGEYNDLKKIRGELKKHVDATMGTYLQDAEDVDTVKEAIALRPKANQPKDFARWSYALSSANEVRVDPLSLGLPPNGKKRPRSEED
jgi:hypothetical protein